MLVGYEITTKAGHTVVSTSEWKVELAPRHYYDTAADRQHWDSKTRVYGAIDTFAAEANELLEANGATPVWGQGDGFKSDETRAAHMKEYRHLKGMAVNQARVGLMAALEVITTFIGAEPVAKVRFSMNAGCSACPCSPGYILDARLEAAHVPIDLWFEEVSER